jgi:predicted ATP-grasp superfamily ATP-dependent carboligase
LPPAVVLNMHYTGLALSRSLRAMGLRVIGLSSDDSLPGNVSNTIEFRRCPDSEAASQQCVQFLLELAAELAERPLLLPTRDHDVHMIRRNRDTIEQAFTLSMPANDVLERVLDKQALYSIAEEVGVACPVSFWIHTPTQMQEALDAIPMPCIAKPVSASDWRKPGIWDAVGRRKAAIFHDRGELEKFYGAICDFMPAMCVQEFIPGDDNELVMFCAYFNARSGTAVSYTARKLLQLPALAGTGIAVQACPVPQIVEPSMRLLRHLGYVGPAEIEYKLDRRSGEYKLIEINTRFWDQHALGAACGADLVQALVEDLVFERPQRHQAGESKVTWIAEDGLLVSFGEAMLNRTRSPTHGRAIWRGRKIFALWSWKDARPALRVAANLVRRLAAAAIRALRRRVRWR